MRLQIVSPEKTIYDGNIRSVTLPGSLGSFTVFPGHAPLISSLDKGEIKYSLDGSAETLPITGGFVEIKEDTISVCVEQ